MPKYLRRFSVGVKFDKVSQIREKVNNFVDENSKLKVTGRESKIILTEFIEVKYFVPADVAAEILAENYEEFFERKGDKENSKPSIEEIINLQDTNPIFWGILIKRISCRLSYSDFVKKYESRCKLLYDKDENNDFRLDINVYDELQDVVINLDKIE